LAPTLTFADRAIVVAGFMGAGKTTVGNALARRLRRPFVDLDREIERVAAARIADLFAQEGEERFRRREAAVAADALARTDRPVIALGGGSLGNETTRALLRERALVAWLDIDRRTAWSRAAGPHRPLTADRPGFDRLWDERRAGYAAAADAIVDAGASAPSIAGALSQQVWTRPGVLELAGGGDGDGRVFRIVDAAVADRVSSDLVLDGGEAGKSPAGLEQLWRALADAGLERSDRVLAVGGGALTDVVGLAAATFRRGIAWIAAPTTLVGQVDAAIGGKTAIDVAAKNDVGAFWTPQAVLSDPELLATLPHAEWSAGFAECLKTALLAGGPLWELVRDVRSTPPGELSQAELVRRCAGFKSLVVADDPRESGLRAILNLGHTVGHGVESAAGYGALRHGEAVAIGLIAALQLSTRLVGLDQEVVDEVAGLLAGHGLPRSAPGLAPAAVLAAMRHDKKRAAGTHRFVLLEAIGKPVRDVEVPDGLVGEVVSAAVRA
jgi:shikimate kinase / 3-dehydroquinate synthase